MRAHKCTQIDTQELIYTCSHMCTHICTDTPAVWDMYIYAPHTHIVYRHTHICKYTCKAYVCMYTHSCIYIYTYIHIHTHMYMYIHKCTQMQHALTHKNTYSCIKQMHALNSGPLACLDHSDLPASGLDNTQVTIGAFEHPIR